MKLKLFSGKRSRSGVFAVITVAVLVLLFALNLLAMHLSIYKTGYADTTGDGLYRVSAGMAEQCKFINDLPTGEGAPELKITFCSDPDTLLGAEITRVTYYMAIQLRNMYPRLEIDEVNVNLNPNAVNKYKTTSLSKISPYDVIISYGDTYRIVPAAGFWTTGSDGSFASYNGEYRLATVLMSVTSKDNPKAYFIKGHGETVYDPEHPETEESRSLATFVDMLRDVGLSVGVLDLKSVTEIPDDCRLLIINNPTGDFATDETRYDEFGYIGELEMVDRYLVNKQGALMVAKDYRTPLKNLEIYLKEWGIGFSDTIVRDEGSSLADEGNTHTSIVASYNTDSTSFAYQVYGDFSALSSSPRTVIPDTGYVYCSYGSTAMLREPGGFNTSRRYMSFLTTSAKSRTYAKSDASGEYTLLAGEDAVRDLVAVSAREELDDYTDETTFSYVMAAASGDFFSEDVIGNASYANFDIVSALAKNISRNDTFASIEIGGMSYNSGSYGGKPLTDMSLSETNFDVYSPSGDEVVETNIGITNAAKIVYTVIIALIPVAIAVAGTVVCLKRRFK